MAECRRANLGDKHPCRSCAVSARAVCNTLDVQALAELRNQGGEVRLSQGEALFHQGDRADCVFSLTSGIIQLYALLPDGRRQVIAFHFPGEFIGLCGWGDHHCTAEAVSRATLCRFDAARFEQFARRKAELAQSSQHRLTGDLIAVRSALQEAGLDYDSAEASFVPSMQVELDADGARKVFRLIEALEDLDDVQNVFHNAEI